MKKIILPIIALAALCTTATAQNSAFEWQAGENTKIKLGGFIRYTVNKEIDSNLSGSNDFDVSKITDADWDNDNYLGVDASASRLSLTITQSTEALGDVKAYVEGDFRGSGSTLRLRQAYVEAKGIIAGQTWSFMTDLAANAPTIDINGVGSRTFLRTQLIGYRHSFSKTLSAGISLENPSLTTDYISGVYGGVYQSTPNIPFYLQMKGGMGHLKVGGMIRTLQYGDLSDEERLSTTGIGGQLSGTLKATDAITIYGQAIYGKGINNYIFDLSGQSVNLMSVDGTTMEATPMGGASIGVGAKLSSKWSAAASFSSVENYGDEDFFEGSFQNSSYLSASLFYAPAPRVTLGAEFVSGSRTDFGSSAVDAQRVSFMVKYTL